jgi:uncharacterized repeat protein (TIGR01451 family)
MKKKNIKEVSAMIRILFASLVVLFGALASSLQAYGTLSGSEITNMTVTNQHVNTNVVLSGALSAAFTNSAGIVGFGFVQGAKVRTTVNAGYDLSVIRMTNARTNLSAVAGSFVLFGGMVTNFGNSSDNITFKVTNIYATAGWSGPYLSLLINSAVVQGPAAGIAYVMANVAPGAVVRYAVQLNVPGALVNGASNRLRLTVEDGIGVSGDAWPPAGAIPPAVADTANARDLQTNFLLASVQGPVLRLSKSASVANARPFELITYTISYTNVGAAAALNVRIFDNIPSNTTNISGMSNRHMAGAWVANGSTPTAKQVRFTPNGGVVPAGEYGLLKFTVQVK